MAAITKTSLKAAHEKAKVKLAEAFKDSSWAGVATTVADVYYKFLLTALEEKE